jgi:hypothetical protein
MRNQQEVVVMVLHLAIQDVGEPELPKDEM